MSAQVPCFLKLTTDVQLGMVWWGVPCLLKLKIVQAFSVPCTFHVNKVEGASNLYIVFCWFWLNLKKYFSFHPVDASQCPRAYLNKKFLSRPKTTAAWTLVPHRSKISKNWNPLHWVPLHRFFKNLFLLIQKHFYSN